MSLFAIKLKKNRFPQYKVSRHPTIFDAPLIVLLQVIRFCKFRKNFFNYKMDFKSIETKFINTFFLIVRLEPIAGSPAMKKKP